MPRIAFDYMFFTDYGWTHTEEEAVELITKNSGCVRDILTVLVLKEYCCGTIWAYPVAGKGMSAAPHIVEAMLADLDACGLGTARIVTKSDQEPAIVEVQVELSRARREIQADGTAEEHSRVGDSSSNGRVERAIQELAGLVRTMKVALEERIGQKVRITHPVVPWLIQHAAGTASNPSASPEKKSSPPAPTGTCTCSTSRPESCA